MKRLSLILLASGGLAIAACQPVGTPEPRPPQAPGETAQLDMRAFQAFIASRPTPAEFRTRFPSILLVLPGEPATMEYRMDNSRFFATLDAQGRITGGDFR